MFKKIFNSFRKKTYSGILQDIIDGGRGDWGGKDKRQGYLLATYLNRALNKRGDKIGQIEFVVKNSNDEENFNDPTLKVLNNPNKFFTGKQFWKLVQLVRDVYGEVYIWKKSGQRSVNEMFDPKKLQELHILAPDTVEVLFDENIGEITGYKQKTADQKEKYFSKDEIIRLYNPDVCNFLKANSLVDLGKKIISTEIQLETYHEKVISNGGRVDSVFIIKNASDIEQLNESADAYDEKYKGASKSGRPLFMGGDVEYKQLGLTPAELSFLESKKMTLNDICVLTGVPKVLLGSVDDIKYDNADASIRVFLRETIKPILQEITDILDVNLYPSDNLTLTFIDPTPEDKEDIRKDVETGHNTYCLTINEKREMLGYEPIKNGEVILVPFNLMPLEQSLNSSNDNDNNNNDNTNKSIDKKDFNHPLRNKNVRKAYHKFKINRGEKQQIKFTKVVKEFFNGQEKRIIERLDPKINRTFRKKELPFDIFSQKNEVKIAIDLFVPVLQEILQESADDTLNFLDYDYNFILTSDVKTFIDQRAEFLAESINKTTFEQLSRRVVESIDAGEGRADLVKKVKELYGDISKGRANTIAHTETHIYIQKGAFEAYKQGGFPIKIWVATFQNTRETHQILDGDEVPIDQPFTSSSGAKLMYPGDSSLGATAEETINCNCVI